MPNISLTNGKLTLSKSFNITDLMSLKAVLKKYNKEIISVYPEGHIGMSTIYILKKYLKHKDMEVPDQYLEQWNLLDVKLPKIVPHNTHNNTISAYFKAAEIFSLTENDFKQNNFWIDTFCKNFMHFVFDNAMIIFILFFGIGITLTYIAYNTLFEYGIELESVKIAILFGLKTFCPMMSVMLLTAKSCTASASIVKTMWINGDFKVMNILNLPYKQVYLHPIFVACAVAGPLLNLVAMVGMLTGSCLSWAVKGHSVKLFFSILSVTDYVKYITNSELRAFLASLFAGICTCVAGLVPGRDFQSIILVINTCITLSFITNIFAQTIVSLF